MSAAAGFVKEPAGICRRPPPFLTFLLLAVLCGTPFCSHAQETVTVQLRWKHSVQFAGFYAAVDQGYYRDAGLEVVLKPWDDTVEVEEVLAGRAQYGVASSELVLARLRGDPVVVLGSIFQRSAYVLMVPEGNGITSLDQLANRPVYMQNPARTAELQAMLYRAGIPRGELQIVSSYPQVDYTDPGILAFGGYVTNEPYLARSRGVPMRVYHPEDFGVEFYGDCLFTTESEIRRHPGRAAAVAAATWRGWRYALDHPEEMLALLREKYALDQYGATPTEEHLRYQLAETRKLVQSDLAPIGYTHRGRWEHIARVYAELGMAETGGTLDGFVFDPQALEKARLARQLRVGGVAAALLAGVAALVVLWNTALRSRVRERTAHLKAVSEREEHLRQGMEATATRYQALVEHLDCGVAVYEADPGGQRFRIREINEAGTRIGQVASEEVVGRYVDEVFPGARGLGLVERLCEVWKTGQPVALPAALYADERLRIWVENYLYRLPTGEVVAVYSDVTERVTAQEKLHASEQQFRSAFEHAGIGMALIGPDGRFLRTNRPLQQMLGYSGEDLEQLRFQDVTVDEDLAPGVAFLQRARAGEADSFQLEKRYRRRDGQIVWARLTASAMRDDDGALVNFVSQIEDVTARKAAEAEQVALRQRLEAFWNIASQVDANHSELCDLVLQEILKITGSEYSFFGFMDGDEQFLTLHSWSRDALADCAVVERPLHFPVARAGIWAEAVRTRRPLLVDEYSSDAPGAIGLPAGHVPLRNLMSVPILKGGRVAAVAAVANRGSSYTEEDARDVEAFVASIMALLEKRQTDEALEWQLRVNRTVAELSNQLIAPRITLQEVADLVLASARALTGSEHGFVSEIDLATGDNVSHTLSAMFGEACRLTGADRRIAFSPEADGTFPKLYGHALNTGESFFTNSPQQHPSTGGVPQGHVPLLQFLSVPVQFGGQLIGQVALANPGRDFTEQDLQAVERIASLYAMALHRHRAEQARLELEAQVREGQKLEAIGTLAGGVAHDFNNILGAILGYSELALQQVPPASGVAEDLAQVIQAGERARELVKQILAFSRRGEQVRRPVQTHLVVAEAMRLLRQTIPSSLPFRVDIVKENDLILADPTQLHQIVMNLCTNAYHAMREGGGVLTISLESVEVGTNLAASVPHLKAGPHVRLTVADTGTGMDPLTQSRIFEPFFTTKPQGEGTGMGLAVVHGIVRSHEGAIQIESQLGRGTKVQVYLPRHGEGGATGPEGELPLPRGTERVLVVDDEPVLARMTQKMLASLGYRVDSVSTSEEALTLVRREPDAFRLVLADQTMPGMTGDVLARKLLGIRPSLAILLCTGYSETLDEDKALAIGAKGLLYKPLELAVLARAVRNALDGA